MVRQEKKCKNPECAKIIYYFENPKKLFCDSTCKSRYHYLKDIKENAEIISLNKALRKNYKIIINFIANGIFIVDAEVARLPYHQEIYNLLRCHHSCCILI